MKKRPRAIAAFLILVNAMVTDEFQNEPQTQVWTFTGLYGVDLDDRSEVDVGGGFLLSKPTEFLLSARSKFDLSSRDFEHIGAADCFFAHRESQSVLRGRERDKKIQDFQSGLTALQILKPVKTSGFIFQGTESGSCFRLEKICSRPPMDPGEWALMRRFDGHLIARLHGLLPIVLVRMKNGSAEERNAVILLQLSLEHFHPLISGLLSVMGLEAMFDSKGRKDFERKLCKRLGESTLVFPDWNSPSIPPPKYTVADVALHLYTLRSMIAHGVDLRKAAQDNNVPVDLTRKVELIEQLDPRPYSVLLSEASVYILCLVLQRELGVP